MTVWSDICHEFKAKAEPGLFPFFIPLNTLTTELFPFQSPGISWIDGDAGGSSQPGNGLCSWPLLRYKAKATAVIWSLGLQTRLLSLFIYCIPAFRRALRISHLPPTGLYPELSHKPGSGPEPAWGEDHSEQGLISLLQRSHFI